MFFRKPIFLDEETWAQLKNLAGSELRAPGNYLQRLITQEWEARRHPSTQNAPPQPRPGAAPTIPSNFHINQGDDKKG